MSSTAFYLRVSKDEQLAVNQRLVLEEVCAREGWALPDPEHVFLDDGFSRSKTRTHRPGFDALCRAIEEGEVDHILVYAIDRLGTLRSTVPFMDLLRRKGCSLYIDVQRLDTTTPMGAAMMSLWGAIGEIELALMSQRVKAGLARARAQGKRLGGKPMKPSKAARITALRQAGLSIGRIRKETGHGTKAIVRVLREHESQPQVASC